MPRRRFSAILANLEGVDASSNFVARPPSKFLIVKILFFATSCANEKLTNRNINAILNMLIKDGFILS